MNSSGGHNHIYDCDCVYGDPNRSQVLTNERKFQCAATNFRCRLETQTSGLRLNNHRTRQHHDMGCCYCPDHYNFVLPRPFLQGLSLSPDNSKVVLSSSHSIAVWYPETKVENKVKSWDKSPQSSVTATDSMCYRCSGEGLVNRGMD